MKIFEVRCGTVKGVVDARSAALAFRKLIRKTSDDDRFSGLARFREVKRRRNCVVPLSPWFYQEPLALERDW